MRRRAFVAFLGAAAAWPRPLMAQPAERRRRIGVLLPFSQSDTGLPPELAAFRQRLQQVGWTDGVKLQYDLRWTGGDTARTRALAKEILALQPDVVLAIGSPVASALLAETRTTPIVFINVADPVGSGLAASLARPGGNATGFSNVQGSLAGKYLELLKDVAPRVGRVGVIFNPKTAPYAADFMQSVEKAAAALKLAAWPLVVEKVNEIEAAVETLARHPDGGLVCMPDATTSTHRTLILSLVARHRLPAVYPYRFFAVEGGLLSYGPVLMDMYLRAAGYVDRILRGEKPGGLPVQAPTQFQLTINLKTAKALGLKVPATLLARADEVIE